MSLDVESQFNGKNLAKLTSLIKNQIKKSIKRKHTLPRYKVRYKPFFQQPISHDGKNEVFVHNSRVTVGKLDVEVLDCSRLTVLPISSQLYCNISIDSLPWSEVMPKNSASWPVHEVSLAFLKNQCWPFIVSFPTLFFFLRTLKIFLSLNISIVYS